MRLLDFNARNFKSAAARQLQDRTLLRIDLRPRNAASSGPDWPAGGASAIALAVALPPAGTTNLGLATRRCCLTAAMTGGLGALLAVPVGLVGRADTGLLGIGVDLATRA